MMCSRRWGAYQVEGSLGFFSSNFHNKSTSGATLAAGTAWRTMTYPFVVQCSQSACDNTRNGRVFRISLSWVEALVVGWLSGLIVAMVCISISDLCRNERQVMARE